MCRVLLVLLVAIVLAARTPAAGAPDPPAQPLLGSALDADALRDLPTANGPVTVLENIQPEAIGTTFLPGLSGITPPQFGGLLNSWTQTQYRVGDVSITDPRSGGTPLLSPLLPVWDRVTVRTGAMGVDDGAPAVSMTLDPAHPGPTWRRTASAFLSGGALAFDLTGPIPSIDVIRQWQDGTLLVSGPLTERAGLVAAGVWRHLAHVPAPALSATEDTLASGFVHLVFAATPRDEIQATGWLQHAGRAEQADTGAHVQVAWARRRAAGASWRLFGGYTSRTRNAPLPSHLVVDSVSSAPISTLADAGAGTTRLWTVGGRLTPAAGSRMPELGVDIEGAEMRAPPAPAVQIDEMAGGLPARIWRYEAGTAWDVRQRTMLAAFANEHLAYGRVGIDAGLRFDRTEGRAAAAAGGITWTNWLPDVAVHADLVKALGLTAIASYRRSADALLLDWLAVGDSAAPVANVVVWNGQSSEPLIARVGPGSGGNPAFARIDPGLGRPVTAETVLAIRGHPLPGLDLELARITKTEASLLQLVDATVGTSDYGAVQVPDPNFLPDSPVGAPLVTAYSRTPRSFGRDAYLLTNRASLARSWALELLARVSTGRLLLLMGGALTWARGPAAAVGVLPTANDQDVLGSALVDPNAAVNAEGQLFHDRSHVVKIAGVYRVGWGLRLGAIARYQDGQPFARLVVVPNRAQGPMAVRAFANGGGAFTHTGTLDIRVQKTFTVARRALTAVVDLYNVRGVDSEVAEYVGSGPAFRTPTARHTPRLVLIGMQVDF